MCTNFQENLQLVWEKNTIFQGSMTLTVATPMDVLVKIMAPKNKNRHRTWEWLRRPVPSTDSLLSVNFQSPV